VISFDSITNVSKNPQHELAEFSIETNTLMSCRTFVLRGESPAIVDSWVEAIRVNWQRYLRLQEEEKQRKEKERRKNYRPCRECDKDLNDCGSIDPWGIDRPMGVLLIMVYSVPSSEFCSMICSTSHQVHMQMHQMQMVMPSKENPELRPSYDEQRRVLEGIAQQEMAERAKARLAEWAKADAASAEPCAECHGRDGGCAFCT